MSLAAECYALALTLPFAHALKSCAFSLAFPVAVYNLSLRHLRSFVSSLIVVLAAGRVFSGWLRTLFPAFFRQLLFLHMVEIGLVAGVPDDRILWRHADYTHLLLRFV